MSNKFEVDFFQLEKLVEASWSGSTILQFCVLQDLIDIHYYLMSDSQRKAIHSFFQTKMNFERAIYNSDTDEIREKIIARFDKKNEYFFTNRPEDGTYFLYKDNYWKNSHEFVPAFGVMQSEADGKKMITPIYEVVKSQNKVK
jgi:hypothetical protein